MPSRDVMDNRIDAQENQTQAAQESGRGGWGSAHPAYGQTLPKNTRPSDQASDGPVLGAQMLDYARIDVFEGPEGIGWRLVTEAEEGGVYYLKTSTYFDGDVKPTQSEWEEQGEGYVPMADTVQTASELTNSAGNQPRTLLARTLDVVGRMRLYRYI